MASLLHGLVHPEMGHIRVPHDQAADPFPGCLPFPWRLPGGFGLGPALEGRWGQRGETLPPEHPAWDLEARYIALGLTSLDLYAFAATDHSGRRCDAAGAPFPATSQPRCWRC